MTLNDLEQLKRENTLLQVQSSAVECMSCLSRQREVRDTGRLASGVWAALVRLNILQRAAGSSAGAAILGV